MSVAHPDLCLLIETLAQPKYYGRRWPKTFTAEEGERLDVREFLESYADPDEDPEDRWVDTLGGEYAQMVAGITGKENVGTTGLAGAALLAEYDHRVALGAPA